MAYLFEVGQVVATPALLSHATVVQYTTLLRRHLSGDWGDMCDEDKKLNDEAIRDGSRIFSSYNLRDEKVWIITEAVGNNDHRELTTIMLSTCY